MLHCPACRHSALGSSPGCSWKPWLQWYTAFVPTVYSLPKTTPFFGALGTPQERAGKEEGKNTAEKSVSFQFYHGFVASELKAHSPGSPIYKSSSPLFNPRSRNECPLPPGIRSSTPVYQCGNSKANAEYQFLLEETLARTLHSICNTERINTVQKFSHRDKGLESNNALYLHPTAATT